MRLVQGAGNECSGFGESDRNHKPNWKERSPSHLFPLSLLFQVTQPVREPALKDLLAESQLHHHKAENIDRKERWWSFIIF
jgi:hypothetical protein